MAAGIGNMQDRFGEFGGSRGKDRPADLTKAVDGYHCCCRPHASVASRYEPQIAGSVLWAVAEYAAMRSSTAGCCPGSITGVELRQVAGFWRVGALDAVVGKR